MDERYEEKDICGSACRSSDVVRAGCAGSPDEGGKGSGGTQEETEIQVFIAASLNTVMTELADLYNEEHPEVKITYNPDSSGTLLTQIEEGIRVRYFLLGSPRSRWTTLKRTV